MLSHQMVHSLPSPTATSLAAAANDVKPQTSYFVHESADPVAVARDGVIVQPSLDDAAQPASRFAKRPVHSLAQFRFDRL